MLHIWSLDFSYIHGGPGRLNIVEYRASVPPTTDAALRSTWHEKVYSGLEGLLDELFLREDATEIVGTIPIHHGQKDTELSEGPRERQARFLYRGETPGAAGCEEVVEVDLTLSRTTGTDEPALQVHLMATGTTHFQNMLLAHVTVMPGVSWADEALDRLGRLDIVSKRGPLVPGAAGFLSRP
ncbi:MAG: hypothetical protein M0Z85_08455 [Gammaproteobacteria bacterium]|nr:hypothetical protein [Gammaproteobacteria bacterium]